MELRAHLYAKDEKEAIDILDNNIKMLNLQDYLERGRHSIEKYWKIEGMFFVYIHFILKKKYIPIIKFEEFVDSLFQNNSSKRPSYYCCKFTNNKICVEKIFISKNSSTFKKINNNVELMTINFAYENDEFEDNKELILIEDDEKL